MHLRLIISTSYYRVQGRTIWFKSIIVPFILIRHEFQDDFAIEYFHENKKDVSNIVSEIYFSLTSLRVRLYIVVQCTPIVNFSILLNSIFWENWTAEISQQL